MKKQWILVALAFAFAFASCTKTDPVGPDPVDPAVVNPETDTDTTPQEIRFSSNLTAPQTKAAVTAWDQHELYIYGYVGGVDGTVADYSHEITDSREGTVDAVNITPAVPSPFGGGIIIKNVKTLAPASGTQGQINVIDANAKDINGNAIVGGSPFYYKDGTPYGATTQVGTDPAANTRDFIYDFYGYYVGVGAKASDPTNAPTVLDIPATYATASHVAPNPTVSATGVTLPIVIDGTQDVMVAKADKAFDVTDQYANGNYLADPNHVAKVRKKDTDAPVDPLRAYTAYSARRGLAPNLIFNHQLSRFLFEIKGADDAATNVMIESIQLYTKTEATLNIAPTPGITIDPSAAMSWLELKQEDGKPLPQLQGTAANHDLRWPTRAEIAATPPVDVPIRPQTDDYHSVGESIMAIPGEAQYTLRVKTILLKKDATYASTTGADDKEFTPLQEFIVDYPIDLSGTTYSPDVYKASTVPGLTNSFINDTFNSTWSGKAAPGFQYKIQLMVYGPEQIVLNVTLNPWISHSTINIDPDAD